jgi:hypothetical protein
LVMNMDQIFVKKHSWQQEFQDFLNLLNQLLPKIAIMNNANNNDKSFG